MKTKSTAIKIPTTYFETIKPFAEAAGITVDQYVTDLLTTDINEVRTGKLGSRPWSLFNLADMMLTYAPTEEDEAELTEKLHKVCLRFEKRTKTSPVRNLLPFHRDRGGAAVALV